MANLESSDFQRAFVALSYMVGRRDSQLLEPLRTSHEDARALARRLGHPERERRAEVLARELSRLASAVEARALK
jgi:hypothetical protein